MKKSKTQIIEVPADSLRRMLWTLRTLGKAYRAGVIRVDESAGFGPEVEARTLLDELAAADAGFGNLLEPGHDREEGR